MNLRHLSLPLAVTAVVVWSVMILGVVVGANAAYEADTAAEATIEVSKHVDEVRESDPKIDGPLEPKIEGTQLGWLNEVLFSSDRFSNWVNQYVVVPGIWFGLTLGDIAAGVFYHHLLWVPVGVANAVFRVAGMAPMVGLLGLYARHLYRLWGDLA